MSKMLGLIILCYVLLLMRVLYAWRLQKSFILQCRQTALHGRNQLQGFADMDFMKSYNQTENKVLSYENAHVPGAKVENISLSAYLDFVVFGACLESAIANDSSNNKSDFHQHVMLTYNKNGTKPEAYMLIEKLLSDHPPQAANTQLVPVCRPLTVVSTIFIHSHNKKAVSYEDESGYWNIGRNLLVEYMPAALGQMKSAAEDLNRVLMKTTWSNYSTYNIRYDNHCRNLADPWVERFPLFLLNKALDSNADLLLSPLSPLSLAVQQMNPLPPFYSGAELVKELLDHIIEESKDRRCGASYSASSCPELEDVRKEMRRGAEHLVASMLQLLQGEVAEAIDRQMRMLAEAREEWREVL